MTSTNKNFGELYVFNDFRKKKRKINIDIEAMKNGYIEMGKINKEEAEASAYTYDDGMWIYNE